MMKDLPIARPRGYKGHYVTQMSSSKRSSSHHAFVQRYYEVQKDPIVIGDQADFLKMIKEMNYGQKKKEVKKMEIKRVPKRKAVANKEQPTPSQNKNSNSESIHKAITPLLGQFRLLNCSIPSNTDVARLRKESQLKIFKYLLFGIEELKYHKEDLNAEQKIVSQLASKDACALARRLTIQIDSLFLQKLNSANQDVVSKEYRNKMKAFLCNIAYEDHSELRKKILTQEIKVQHLAEMDDLEFYPVHVREKIKKNKNQILREAAMNTLLYEVLKEHSGEQQIETDEDEQDQTCQLPSKQSCSGPSILMNNDLFQGQQASKMKLLLDFDLTKESEEKVMKSGHQILHK